MKKLFITLAICFGISITAPAAILIGGGLALTIATNSPTFSTNYASLTVPAISLAITATNALTVITNCVSSTAAIGGTSYTVQTTFIYNATTHGTNFSTNFPAYNIQIPVATLFQAIPQNGGTNTSTISATY